MEAKVAFQRHHSSGIVFGMGEGREQWIREPCPARPQPAGGNASGTDALTCRTAWTLHDLNALGPERMRWIQTGCLRVRNPHLSEKKKQTKMWSSLFWAGTQTLCWRRMGILRDAENYFRDGRVQTTIACVTLDAYGVYNFQKKKKVNKKKLKSDCFGW